MHLRISGSCTVFRGTGSRNDGSMPPHKVLRLCGDPDTRGAVPTAVRIDLKQVDPDTCLTRCMLIELMKQGVILSQNVPIQTVSKYLGHSDSTITLEVYSHFIPDTQEKAVFALNNLTK